MNDEQKLHLQRMISSNNVLDQTELIRKLKHSYIFKNEINTLLLIKAKYPDDEEKIKEECINECGFLFTYYTDLFNKIRKNEIDLNILYQFIEVLRKIEEAELDQHEGSFLIGTLLKELYVDSALKKADKINEKYKEEIKPKEPMIPISWKQFKYKEKK
jgi:dimeric dUTPase (all-alpha-NTP-PPase superfamily)